MAHRKNRNLSGKELNELWGVGAKHALYREDGKWYHRLREFPGALFDANGYVVFETEKDYLECEYLQITQHIHVPKGISAIPGYVCISEQAHFQEVSRQIRKTAKQKSLYTDRKRKASGRKFILPPEPKPADLAKPKRVQTQTRRVLRDTKISQWVKYIHEYRCQLCGQTIELGNDKFYAEAHHIQPLGEPHNGPDVIENIICVCPNCHVLLDYGAVLLNVNKIANVEGHEIDRKYIEYHNTVIYKRL